jgi:hypothetical protein
MQLLFTTRHCAATFCRLSPLHGATRCAGHPMLVAAAGSVWMDMVARLGRRAWKFLTGQRPTRTSVAARWPDAFLHLFTRFPLSYALMLAVSVSELFWNGQSLARHTCRTPSLL